MKRLSSRSAKSFITVPVHPLSIAVLLLAMLPLSLKSQWSADCRINTPICTAIGDQTDPQIISDGAGGAIIVWYDQGSGMNGTVYVQHVDRAGIGRWTSIGLPVVGLGQRPKVVSDGSGGIIFSWMKWENGKNDLLAQRMDREGRIQWPTGGISVSQTASPGVLSAIIADGAGGAIVAWESNNDIYGQRVDHDGNFLWNANPLPICTAPGIQSKPQLVSDGYEGAIIAWSDERRDTVSDIYAQRVGPNGYRNWSVDGVVISAGTNSVERMISDGNGGAILQLKFLEQHNTGPAIIGVQRVNLSGNVLWPDNGVVICPYQAGTAIEIGPILTDHAGGAVVVWAARPSHGITNTLLIQHVNAAGLLQWGGSGIPVLGKNGQNSCDVIDDDAGGMILTWSNYDYRDNSAHIYAQRVNASGAPQWVERGIPVCIAEGRQTSPRLVRNGMGGAYIVWQDTRSGYSDIYAQNVDASGRLGLPPAIIDVRDVPNDQGGRVEVLWDHSHIDALGNASAIETYEIFRGVTASAANKKYNVLTGKDYHAVKSQHADTAIYMTNGNFASSGDPIYWEFVSGIQAKQLEHYSAAVPTLCDSGPQGNSQFYYMIRAYISPGVYWDSQPDSGYSVDNLPPGPVGTLHAALLPDATVKIHWPPCAYDPDVQSYVIYRSTTSGFRPDLSTQLAVCCDTAFIDTDPPKAEAAYYLVAGRDIHGNLGKSSPEVSLPLNVTDIQEGENSALEFSLGQNYPNPFNPSTVIPFTIASASHVTLTVYDMLGRQLAVLVKTTMEPGTYTAEWNAAEMSSGIYFYRLDAGTYSVVRKLMLQK